MSENKQISAWQRVRQLPGAVKSVLEGSWRGPFSLASGYGDSGAYHMLGALDNGFQRNLDINPNEVQKFGPFYACVSILAQELSRIKIEHYRNLPDGQRELVVNKAPFRIFRKPNHYQSKSDFILYLMHALLTDGNAYAVATRNDRFEVDALYPISPRNIWPYIVEGEVFYHLGDQNITELAQLEKDQWFPARDVLHIRMFCPKHPLIGESPITAAMYPAITGMQINAQTAHFFKNMSRPAGVLRYPGKLGATAPLQETAIKRIKERFMEVTQGRAIGEPLVLQENAQWSPMTMSAVDSELIGSFKLTERQIAQVFRVPPFLLGDLDKGNFNNVESLSRFFISSALGWYIDHFEDALTQFFVLPADEEIHFDVDTALLRGDLESRMAAYAKGIQSGVYSPNEARSREKLAPVKDGDEPRVQQQLVPLSYGMGIQPPTPGGAPAPAPEPAEEPEPTEEEKQAAAFIAQKAIEKAMHG